MFQSTATQVPALSVSKIGEVVGSASSAVSGWAKQLFPVVIIKLPDH